MARITRGPKVQINEHLSIYSINNPQHYTGVYWMKKECAVGIFFDGYLWGRVDSLTLSVFKYGGVAYAVKKAVKYLLNALDENPTAKTAQVLYELLQCWEEYKCTPA